MVRENREQSRDNWIDIVIRINLQNLFFLGREITCRIFYNCRWKFVEFVLVEYNDVLIQCGINVPIF